MEQQTGKTISRDNTTSQSAALYDANVEKTIPRYSQFHSETLDLVGAVIPNPSLWLDTGCGTGNLAAKAAERFAGVKFILSDPSPAMLNIAREKLPGMAVEYIQSGSETLVPQSYMLTTHNKKDHRKLYLIQHDTQLI